MVEYTLREATPDDMLLLFDWTNDPEVRAQSFSSDAISLANHQNWFSGKLCSDCAQIWILTENGVPVGQIRCDCNEQNEGVLSYSIANGHRCKGHGKRIVQMVQEKIQTRFPRVETIVAFVKPENAASQHVFLANGYEGETERFVLRLPR